MNLKYGLSITLMIVLTLNPGCRLKKESKNIDTFKPALVTFLDSSNASKAILIDKKEGFYDVCSKTEMEIQMKSKISFENREKALKAYTEFLQKEVSNWTLDEKIAIEGLFRKVKNMCDSLNPRIFPSDIRLIKVKTNHYGKDVYYTRDNHIMIPENIFPMSEGDQQLPVMLHEVFHILSRYQPALKNELYNEIGFKKLDKPVLLNDILKEVLLSNPDGISTKYAISLERNSDEFLAIPLITSKYKYYKENLPGFFDYLNFDLYELKDNGKFYLVTTNAKGETTIPLESTPSFFTKIKDNTQYIIHPDEIMADNFMLAVLAYNKGDYSKFSKDGKILIDKVLAHLKNM